MILQSLIQIVDIGLQISVMMQLHRLPADVRFHRIIRIGKRRIDKGIVFVQGKFS